MFTPYGASQVANSALEVAGVDKVLPPQMFYNYTTSRIKKGKEPLIECVVLEDGTVRVTEEGLQKWLEKYLVKNGVATLF